MKGVTIAGVDRFDGEHPLDLKHLKASDYGLIKRLSGYLPVDVPDGIAGYDLELISAIAVVALRRNGKVAADDGEAQARQVYEKLIDCEAGAITLDLGSDEEGEARPPAQSSTGNGGSRGPGSSKSSETSRHLPRVGGTRDSAGPGLGLVRSVS